MKIDCQICGTPIDINVLVVPADGAIRGRCPACDAIYVVRPPRKSFDLPSIKFAPSEKVERTCLRCGRIFRGPATVSIPTCPECGEEPVLGKDRPPRPTWRVEKSDGNVYGPYSAEELAQHIRDRLFDRQDIGINSQGNRMSLGNFSEFRGLFKEKKPFVKIPRPSASGSMPAIKSRWRRLARPLGAALLLVAALAAWRLYLGQRRAAAQPDPRQLQRLLGELAIPPLPWPLPQKIAAGEKALSRGTAEGDESAARFFVDAALSAPDAAGARHPLALYLEALAGLAGHWKEAERANLYQVVARLVQQSPGEAASYRALARLQQQQGDLTQAGQALAQALDLAPTDPRSVYLFDLNQALMQKINGATAPVDSWPLIQAAKTPAPYPAALLEGARLLDGAGHPGLAYQFRQRYLALFPQEKEALLQQANTLIRLGRNREAAQWLQPALVRHPQDPDLRLTWLSAAAADPEAASQVAVSLAALDDAADPALEEKLAEWKVHTALAAGHTAPLLPLLRGPLADKIDAGLTARAFYAAGKKADALECLEKGGIAADRLAGLKLQGQILSEFGRGEKAAQVWQTLQREFPERIEGYAHLALARAEEGRGAEVLALLGEAFGKVGLDERSDLAPPDRPLLPQALRLIPSLSGSRNARAAAEVPLLYLLAIGGDSRAAARLRQRLETWAAEKDDGADLARLYLGRFFFVQGEVARAKEWLSLVTGAGRNHPAYNYNATLILIASGASAVEQATAVQSPDFPSYLTDYAAGRAYLAAGDKEKGITRLQQALRAQADFFPAYQLLFNSEGQP